MIRVQGVQEPHPVRDAAVVVALAGLTLMPFRANATAQSGVPPHARVVEASIEEHPPFDPKAIFERAVTVRLVLAARPRCQAEDTPTYAFLVDAFPWQRQSVRIDGFDELRFQTALRFTCDPATGRFSSNVRGDVAVEPLARPPGAHALVLRTRVGDLPAIEFRWIAIAAAGEVYTRAPVASRFAVWRIHERALR